MTPRLYDVHLTLDPNAPHFTGHVAIAVELREDHQDIFLHAEGLRFKKVWATSDDGRSQRAEVSDDKTPGLINLRFAAPLQAGMATLHFSYEGTWSTNLLGLYRVKTSQGSAIFSQFEAIAARRAMPCFDEPRFKTPFALRVTAPKELTVLTGSVGLAEQVKEKEGVAEAVKTITFAPTPPLPTYLLAFAVGPFASTEGEVAANAWRSYPLPLRVFGTAGQGAQLSQSKRLAGQLLSALEAYTQLGYPFAKLDLLAVPDFAFGAMENAGLVTFRDDLLLLGEHAPYHRLRSVVSVTAHELTHQWFGNWVTMPWWDDLWLNESFASWRGARTAHALRPEMRFDLELVAGASMAMHGDRLRATRRMREPVRDRDDIFNSADATVYQKGAGLLNMVEHWLGHDGMARGIRMYLAEHPFGTATSADFLAALAKGADEPAVPGVMRSFLEQPGVPEIDFALRCTEGQGVLDIGQDRYRALGSDLPSAQWQVPICIRYGGSKGDHKSCLLLTEARTQWSLHGGCPNWLVVNADGAGYYRSRGNAAATALRVAALLAGRLTPTEHVAFIGDLRAGLASGAVPPNVVLPLFARGLQAEEPAVLRQSANALLGAYARHVEKAPSPQQVRTLAALLAPSLAASEAEVARRQAALQRSLQHGAAGDAARDRLGEAVLARLLLRAALAQEGRDRHLRANLSHAGVAWIERLEHTRQNPAAKEALPYAAQDAALTAEEADLSLAMATSSLGVAFAERLIEALSLTSGGHERATIVAALAAQDNQDVAKLLRARLLGDTFRVNERMQLLAPQLYSPSLSDAAWAFVQAELPALLATLSEHDRQWLVAAMGTVSDAALGASLLALFERHLDLLPGGPRLLAQAGEEQKLLMAESAAVGAGVQAYFAARPSMGGRAKQVALP